MNHWCKAPEWCVTAGFCSRAVYADVENGAEAQARTEAAACVNVIALEAAFPEVRQHLHLARTLSAVLPDGKTAIEEERSRLVADVARFDRRALAAGLPAFRVGEETK